MASNRGSRQVGLARALSKLGYSSRSAAFNLIRAGLVSLNGAIRRDPEAPVHLEKDRIEVDGKPLTAAAAVYLLLNKPPGIITTASDEKGRHTVYEFLGPAFLKCQPSASKPWIAPVGRLDKASEGMLLLTNDSEWAAQVLSPGTHLAKTYHVQIGRVADEELLESLARGVTTKDGEILRIKRARVLRGGHRNTWLEIVLDEGKNRHIRRMLEELGVEILRLVRVAIGPLSLGQLPKGGVRPLTASEKEGIDRAMQKEARR